MRLSSLPIAVRIGMAVIAPMIGFAIFAIIQIVQNNAEAERMRVVSDVADFSVYTADVMHELQRERGRTAGFYGSGRAAQPQSALERQRRATDAAEKASGDAADFARQAEEMASRSQTAKQEIPDIVRSAANRTRLAS